MNKILNDFQLPKVFYKCFPTEENLSREPSPKTLNPKVALFDFSSFSLWKIYPKHEPSPKTINPKVALFDFSSFSLRKIYPKHEE
jgi:hypothetical protein